MLQRLSFALRYLLGKPPWDSGIPAPELVRAIEGRPPGKAIDLGCGTGTNVRYLAAHGWQVTGIDFVPRAIAQARRKLRDLPAQLLVGDVTRLESLPLHGPYDLALDMGCFHSLPEAGRPRYAACLAGALRPGGRFLLYAWQPGPDGGAGIAREALRAYFQPGFRLVGYEQGRGRPSAWYYFERGDAEPGASSAG
jgi:SAM-dependent methyltransferase